MVSAPGVIYLHYHRTEEFYQGDAKCTEECSHGDSHCTEKCTRRNLTIITRKSASRESQNERKSAPDGIGLPLRGIVLPVYLKCTVECSQRARVLLEICGKGAPCPRTDKSALSGLREHMTECSRRNQTTMLSASGVFINWSAHGDDIRLFIRKPLRARYGFFLLVPYW